MLTLGALGLYFGIRSLPTGTNLSHMDFRPGGTSVEFCDPANPQFIPVIAVRSPVEMQLATGSAAREGERVEGTLTLKSATGRPIGPEDLLVVHTQKLHLLLVDPTLSDYQHVHPQPGRTRGEWIFAFTPVRAGAYRVFADFTPAATARGLYAGAELNVAGSTTAGSAAASPKENRTYEKNGYRFHLRPASEPIRAGRLADLTFEVERGDGGVVPLQPVMQAYAHLVAFDQARSGFAHLHPNETDLSRAPDGRHPRLTFKVTIPKAGRYVVWSQVNLAGTEVFAPFWFEVKN